MEINTRYGLEFNPFLKNSREILFTGKEYTEALYRLDYLSRTKGFGVPYLETAERITAIRFTKLSWKKTSAPVTNRLASSISAIT